jgi:hypothetical protein
MSSFIDLLDALYETSSLAAVKVLVRQPTVVVPTTSSSTSSLSPSSSVAVKTMSKRRNRNNRHKRASPMSRESAVVRDVLENKRRQMAIDALKIEQADLADKIKAIYLRSFLQLCSLFVES